MEEETSNSESEDLPAGWQLQNGDPVLSIHKDMLRGKVFKIHFPEFGWKFTVNNHATEKPYPDRDSAIKACQQYMVSSIIKIEDEMHDYIEQQVAAIPQPSPLILPNSVHKPTRLRRLK